MLCGIKNCKNWKRAFSKSTPVYPRLLWTKALPISKKSFFLFFLERSCVGLTYPHRIFSPWGMGNNGEGKFFPMGNGEKWGLLFIMVKELLLTLKAQLMDKEYFFLLVASHSHFVWKFSNYKREKTWKDWNARKRRYMKEVIQVWKARKA